MVKDVSVFSRTGSRPHYLLDMKKPLKQSKDSKYKPELLPIYSSTFAVIFLGTPHRGSNWVDIAENATIFALGKRDVTLLRSLRVDSEVLQRLVDDFSAMLKDDAFKVHSFIEGYSMTDITGFNKKVSVALVLEKLRDFTDFCRLWRISLASLAMQQKPDSLSTQTTEPCANTRTMMMITFRRCCALSRVISTQLNLQWGGNRVRRTEVHG